MKRILIVCLLGMGLLLPSTTITANNFIAKRIIDVTIEEAVLLASSDANTGTLVKVEIFTDHEEFVKGQQCSGYSCYVSLESLDPGNYVAHVTTTLTSYNEEFNID